jgi:hypothetical protein
MAMQTLKLSLGGSCHVQLHVSDFNRLRWVVYAIESNEELRQQLLQQERVSIYESTCLAGEGVQPELQAYVILWDGLNSQIELMRSRAELQHRADLKYLYVGSFSEIAGDLPAQSRPLFPRRDALVSTTASVPLQFRAKRLAKTAARPLKNAVYDFARHTALARGKNVVFCGLVRPTPAVISKLLTNQKLQSLRKPVSLLGTMHWNDSPGRISEQVQTIYNACQNLQASSAEEFGAIYSLLNICSRMAVISQLHAAGCQMFISEYGFQKNFDAYDTFAYGNNTFLDFGSSRGACYWYPRTMDMRATGKEFVALRMIQEDQSLAAYLAAHCENDYLAQLNADATTVLNGLRTA